MKRFSTLKKKQSAFTLIEIMVVIAIIGIVVAIAATTWLRQREMARSRSCQENLSKIDGAKEQWALDNNEGQGATVAMGTLVGATAYIKGTPECPAGGTYTTNDIGADPTCDYTAEPFAPPHAIGGTAGGGT